MTGGVRPDYRLISKTSRFYIGLAVGLPVFSKISLILTHVQTVLSLQRREKPHQETEWTDSLFSLFSLCISHFIIHERFKCMNIVILKIALFRRFTALCLTD